VPVQVEWPVVEIDDVDGGFAKVEKRRVVVLDGSRAVEEVATVAQAPGLAEHDIAQPGGRMSFPVNVDASAIMSTRIRARTWFNVP